MRNEHEDHTRVERVDPLVGAVLDNRYRIDFRLAAGGFGAIYRATHIKTQHQVALKVLHTELATNDARVIARFRREAATLMQLRSPHTITAYEIGEDPEGPLYIVMELLHGESLYEVYRAKGTLPWSRMVAIARMVCSSLEEAHAIGIVHRDLKPANIHLEEHNGHSDFVKVLDFGIAKIKRDSDLDNTELTQAGQMIGTFDYMAPEQMVGGQCTAATDIYTLGVVMYEMIAGRRPFMDANSPTAMLAALLTQTAPPLSSFVRVPDELDRIMARCLEREPQNRYSSVGELAIELERLLVPDEGLTGRMAATPAPEILMSDEVTVIDTRQNRPKRDSQPPHVVRREGSSPAIAVGRPKRDSAPPQQLRQGTGPAPLARDGSSPAIPVGQGDRTKRESQPPPTDIGRPRRDSAAPPTDMGRPHRDSAPPPMTPTDRSRRDSAPPQMTPTDRSRRDSAPPQMPDPRASQPMRQSYPHMVETATGVPTNVRREGSGPVPDPRASQPMYQTPAVPMPIVGQPGSAPIHVPQQMGAVGWYPPHQPHQAPSFGHNQFPSTHGGRSGYPQHPQAPQYPPQRPSDLHGYDMAGARNRDVMVRRIVWAVAILLGVILAIVIMSKLG